MFCGGEGEEVRVGVRMRSGRKATGKGRGKQAGSAD